MVRRSGRQRVFNAYTLYFCLEQVSSQAFGGVGVRLVAVPGGAAHAGLLEMEMEAGGYGTVCGLNSQAANWLADRLALSSVLCRQRAVQSMGAQAFVAQAVPLLPQKPCIVQAQR